MQDPYRSLPPPAQMYPGYGPPMGYAAPAQPAPRQRTAIACRYCRRRKVCGIRKNHMRCDATRPCDCAATAATRALLVACCKTHTDAFTRSAALASISLKMAAAQTANAFLKNVSSPRFPPRPRPSSQHTLFGVASSLRRMPSSMVSLLITPIQGSVA